jgi:SAM-dependent methyltransferase
VSARLNALVDVALKSGAQARDVVELSRLFGEERSKRSSDYMTDPRLRAAYLAFFVPQYAAKVAGLLAMHERDGVLKLPDAPRVLDVGAGPLSATLGVWLHKGALGAGSVALDLARKSLDAGATLLAQLDVKARANVALVDAPLSRRPLPLGPFDLVVIAHVLNEVGDPRRAIEVRTQLVRDLAGTLAPNGRVLVVEPATRVHGRALMAVRDALVDAGVPVLSPCRGARACPLLRTAGDWCHGDVDWSRPPKFAALEAAARLPKDVLKQSHVLVARPEDAKRDDVAGPPSGGRIVSGLMKDREGVERRYVCARDLVVLRGRPRLDDDVARPLRHGLLAREARANEIDTKDDRTQRNDRPQHRTERSQRDDRTQRNDRGSDRNQRSDRGGKNGRRTRGPR